MMTTPIYATFIYWQLYLDVYKNMSLRHSSGGDTVMLGNGVTLM